MLACTAILGCCSLPARLREAAWLQENPMPPVFPLQRSTSSAAFGALPAGFPAWLKTILAIDAEKNARSRRNRLDTRTTDLCKFAPPLFAQRFESSRLCRREAGMADIPRFL
jgi:hypothetical protein